MIKMESANLKMKNDNFKLLNVTFHFDFYILNYSIC